MLDSLDTKPWPKEHRWRWRTVIVIVAFVCLLVLLSLHKWEHASGSLEKDNIVSLNANSLPPVSLLHELAQAATQRELNTKKNTIESAHAEAMECIRKPRKHAVPDYVKSDKLLKFIDESDKVQLFSPIPGSLEAGISSPGRMDRDIVVRNVEQSTESLVKRCRALGFLEGELCRLRICSGLWGIDPACPNGNNRDHDRS